MTKIEPEQEERAAARSGESELLRRAIELARVGDATAARVLLVDICRKNNQSELGWLWLASVARNSREALACTKQVLRINPANEHAQAWVEKLTAQGPAAQVELGVPETSQAEPIEREASEPTAIASTENADTAQAETSVAITSIEVPEQNTAIQIDEPEVASQEAPTPEATPAEAVSEPSALQSLAAAVDQQQVEDQQPQETQDLVAVPAQAIPETDIEAPAPEAVIEIAGEEAPEATVEMPSDITLESQPVADAAPERLFESVPESLPEAEAVVDPVTEVVPGVAEPVAAELVKAVPFEEPTAAQPQIAAPAPRPTNASELAAAIARPRATTTSAVQPVLPHCPICDGNLTTPEQCGTCKAIIWPADPMQYVLNWQLDRPMMARWREKLQAAPDSVANHLRLVLACCNLHDFAGARFHLNHAAMADFNATRFALESLDAFLRRPAVLLVDDNATVRDEVLPLLGANSLLPIPVADPSVALSVVSEQAPVAVLLHVTVPLLEGFEVCRQIRAHREFKSLPVIVISSHDGVVQKVVARMAGASAYVVKPIKPDQLLSIVLRHAMQPPK